jgi:hypothetical protein
MRTHEPKDKDLYGKIHERVNYLGVTAHIRVDSRGVFTCKIGDAVQHGLLPDLRSWAKQEIQKSSKLVWHPILEVNGDLEDTSVNHLEHCTNLSYHIERFYVAWDGKKWIQCPWSVQPVGTWRCDPHAPSNEEQEPLSTEELAQARIFASRECSFLSKYGREVSWPLYEENWSNSRAYYVPYNQTTWDTMLGMIDKVRALRKQVDELLTTSEGWNKLAVMTGVKQLGGPKIFSENLLEFNG